MEGTIIIGEAGVNHNGDINLAKELIDIAAETGVDYIKFQTFKAEKLASNASIKANYQAFNIKDDDLSQYSMLKKLELDLSMHKLLIDYCFQKQVKFLSTPFDVDSLLMLVELGIDFIKIPSGEITNIPFLKIIGIQDIPVILSTGMANMKEIEVAINTLNESGLDKNKITVLHCNTQYPTPMKDVNLNAMISIANTFSIKIGYSDHTLGIEVPIAAVALGAKVIEKHFTLDRKLPGPDHASSLEPNELKAMVKAIRNIEKALGNGIKEPSESEKENINIVRKSIHLVNAKRKNEIISEADLVMLRPGNGISPVSLERVLNKKVIKDLPSGHMLSWSDLL